MFRITSSGTDVVGVECFFFLSPWFNLAMLAVSSGSTAPPLEGTSYHPVIFKSRSQL